MRCLQELRVFFASGSASRYDIKRYFVFRGLNKFGAYSVRLGNFPANFPRARVAFDEAGNFNRFSASPAGYFGTQSFNSIVKNLLWNTFSHMDGLLSA